MYSHNLLDTRCDSAIKGFEFDFGLHIAANSDDQVLRSRTAEDDNDRDREQQQHSTVDILLTRRAQLLAI